MKDSGERDRIRLLGSFTKMMAGVALPANR